MHEPYNQIPQACHHADSKGAYQAMNSQMRMMADARLQATFDSYHLGEIIYGSKETVINRKEAWARVENILDLEDINQLPHCYKSLTREEEYLDGLRIGKVLLDDDRKSGKENFAYCTHRHTLGNSTGIGVHALLFTPFLKQQLSDEQAKYSQAVSLALTAKPRHGSHVGGIETTATFDEETDEFVIHSPTTTSAKYWPGGIGFTCSHAIVMARLIVSAKDYGIHPFMVQLRSSDDYKPLGGIELGDNGSNMAYNGTDNGYAIFKNVRIPRNHLFNRFATVARDGTYKRATIREKLMYGGMLDTRFLLIRQCGIQFAQAITVATRYSVVREQGSSPFSEGNATPVSIINFKSQHYRLLTLISKAYANVFVWKKLETSFIDMKRLQSTGDQSALAHNHILMAGVKAWITEHAANGAEDARRMCGGHGYMNISGMPEIVLSIVAQATFEGENWVMWQQVAVYLIKGLAASELPIGMAYMNQHRQTSTSKPCTTHGSDFLSPIVLRQIFEHRASRLTIETAALLNSASLSKSAAWNKNMMSLVSAARAHIDVYMLTSYADEVSLLPPSATRDVLSKLVSLYGLTTIVAPDSNNAISFCADGLLSNTQLAEMREQVDILLEQLLPDAIALTDAWQFTDASLCSAIGCKDGNVYERIMMWTKQLPMNINAKADGGVFKEYFEKHILPVIRAKL